MSSISNLEKEYINLLKEFSNKTEILGASLKVRFENREDAGRQGQEFFQRCISYKLPYINPTKLKDREEIEQDYYILLLLSLVQHYGEVSSYDTNFDIEKSRRITFVNTECISMIQVLIRDEIHLHIHMRSSLVTDALPSDLKFFTTLGYNFLDKIKKPSNKPLNLFVTFGSLHSVV